MKRVKLEFSTTQMFQYQLNQTLMDMVSNEPRRFETSSVDNMVTVTDKDDGKTIIFNVSIESIICLHCNIRNIMGYTVADSHDVRIQANLEAALTSYFGITAL